MNTIRTVPVTAPSGGGTSLPADFLNAYENVTPGAIPWLDRWFTRVRGALDRAAQQEGKK